MCAFSVFLFFSFISLTRELSVVLVLSKKLGSIPKLGFYFIDYLYLTSVFYAINICSFLYNLFLFTLDLGLVCSFSNFLAWLLGPLTVSLSSLLKHSF